MQAPGSVIRFMSCHRSLFTRYFGYSIVHLHQLSCFSPGIILRTYKLLTISFDFLKEWIQENWEKSYYITAVAGANNGSSLVVMSKGQS